ncbi:MAG: hypothetical protein GY744_08905 [Gammaproteobacteria bacterium]|nr:hypothetical protein [Gammaproteobacteria bacterium]
MNKISLIIVAIIFSALASYAQATTILPSYATPATGSTTTDLTQGSLSLVSDNDYGTGYLVTNTSVNSALAYGFNIRFDFDISQYTQVDSFSFDFKGIYNSDNVQVQKIAFGSQPIGNITLVDTPIGQEIDFLLSTTSIESGVYDTDNYISTSGDTLSVYLQTWLGSGGGSYTEINTLEISANIDGQKVSSVPTPTPLALMILGLAALCWTKCKASQTR